MTTFLTVVILIVCFLLGAVILVQNPKGGGLATGFQGASQIGGVQRTTNFLEKATWVLAVSLFVLCILVGSFAGNGSPRRRGRRKLRAHGTHRSHGVIPTRPGPSLGLQRHPVSHSLTGCRAFGPNLTDVSGPRTGPGFGTEIA